MTMDEMVQEFDKLENMMKQKSQRKGRGSSSSSTNMDDNEMEAFYPPSRERNKRRSHKSKHEEKLFKHSVEFPKFSDDLDPNVYEEWEGKVNQIVYFYDFKDREILKLVVVEFNAYYLFWWNKYQKYIIDGKHSSINTWKDLKNALRKKLWSILQLKKFIQGSKSV